MRKAVVRESDGFVLNVIEIEEEALKDRVIESTEEGGDPIVIPAWPIPDGCILVDAERNGPGDTWDGDKFISPSESEPAISPDYTVQYKTATTQEEKNHIFAKMLELVDE